MKKWYVNWYYRTAARWVNVDATWLSLQFVVPLAVILLLYAVNFGTDGRTVIVADVVGALMCMVVTRLTVKYMLQVPVVLIASIVFGVTFWATKDSLGELSLLVTFLVTFSAALATILFVRVTNGGGTT